MPMRTKHSALNRLRGLDHATAVDVAVEDVTGMMTKVLNQFAALVRFTSDEAKKVSAGKTTPTEACDRIKRRTSTTRQTIARLMATDTPRENKCSDEP